MHDKWGWAAHLQANFKKHFRRKQLGEARRGSLKSYRRQTCQKLGVRRDGFLRVGTYHAARGPGIAGGTDTALIDSLIKELGRL